MQFLRIFSGFFEYDIKHLTLKSLFFNHTTILAHILDANPLAVNFTNQNSDSLLHIAYENSQEKIIDYLLANPYTVVQSKTLHLSLLEMDFTRIEQLLKCTIEESRLFGNTLWHTLLLIFDKNVENSKVILFWLENGRPVCETQNQLQWA